MVHLRFQLRYPVLLVLMLLLPTIAVQADDRPVLQGAYLDFPPLAITNAQGEAEGSFIELAERLADKSGYRIEWQELPIGRVYLYLQHGTVDFWLGSSGVQQITSYTREVDFQPMRIRLNAYHKDSTPTVAGIDDLAGTRLILIRGYTYWRLFDRFIQSDDTPTTQAPDHQSALRMLAFDRGDYLINFEAPMDHVLAQSPFPGLTSSSLVDWPLTLVFSRHTHDLEQVLDDFNEAWQALGSPMIPGSY